MVNLEEFKKYMDTNLMLAFAVLIAIFSIIVLRTVLRKQDEKWEDEEYDKAFKRIGLYQQGYDEEEKVKNDELYIQDTQQFLNNAKVIEDEQYVRVSDFLRDDNTPDYSNYDMSGLGNTTRDYIDYSDYNNITEEQDDSAVDEETQNHWETIRDAQQRLQKLTEKERTRQAEFLNNDSIDGRKLDEWLDDMKRKAAYSRQKISPIAILNAIETLVKTSRYFEAKKLASEHLTGIEYAAAFKYINEASGIINRINEARQHELMMARDLFSSNLISQKQAKEILNDNSLKAQIEAHPILQTLIEEFRNTLENCQSPDVQGTNSSSYGNDTDWTLYNLQLVKGNRLQNAISSNMKAILFPEDSFDNRYFMSVGSQAESLIKVLCENALLEEFRTMGGNRWIGKEKYGIQDTVKPEMFILMKPQMGALIAFNYLIRVRPNYYATVSKDTSMSDKDYHNLTLKSITTNKILENLSGNIMELYEIKNPKNGRSASRNLTDCLASFYVIAEDAESQNGQLGSAFVKTRFFNDDTNTTHELFFEVPKTIYNVPVKYYTDNNNWSSIYPIIVIVRQHNGNFKGYGFNRDLKSFCSFDMSNISEEIATDNVTDDVLNNPFEFPVYANVPFSINPHSVQIMRS